VRVASASCFLGVIISFRSEANDTKMHISRGEARTPTHPAHEPSSHREAQTDVARSTTCFAVSLSFVRLPVLSADGMGCATGRLSTSPRARLTRS